MRSCPVQEMSFVAQDFASSNFESGIVWPEAAKALDAQCLGILEWRLAARNRSTTLAMFHFKVCSTQPSILSFTYARASPGKQHSQENLIALVFHPGHHTRAGPAAYPGTGLVTK